MDETTKSLVARFTSELRSSDKYITAMLQFDKDSLSEKELHEMLLKDSVTLVRGFLSLDDKELQAQCLLVYMMLISKTQKPPRLVVENVIRPELAKLADLGTLTPEIVNTLTQLVMIMPNLFAAHFCTRMFNTFVAVSDTGNISLLDSLVEMFRVLVVNRIVNPGFFLHIVIKVANRSKEWQKSLGVVTRFLSATPNDSFDALMCSPLKDKIQGPLTTAVTVDPGSILSEFVVQCDDIEALRNFTIVCGGPIHCHKFALAAASPFFKDYLCKNPQSTSITIECDTVAFQSIMDTVYHNRQLDLGISSEPTPPNGCQRKCCCVDLSFGHYKFLLRVFEVGIKFQFTSIVSECCKMLAKNLTSSTLPHLIRTLANHPDFPALHLYCETFATSHMYHLFNPNLTPIDDLPIEVSVEVGKAIKITTEVKVPTKFKFQRDPIATRSKTKRQKSVVPMYGSSNATLDQGVALAEFMKFSATRQGIPLPQ